MSFEIMATLQGKVITAEGGFYYRLAEDVSFLQGEWGDIEMIHFYTNKNPLANE